ncbi:MAG: hypothetical protein AAF988_09015 [Pseudomonadota bacterium]
MTTLLPKDADNNIIPALRLKDSGAHTINTTTSSTRNATAFDGETKVISLYATEPVFVAFGDSAVTANLSDHFFPAGIYYDVAISGGSGKASKDLYIAAIAESADGILYISEKE